MQPQVCPCVRRASLCEKGFPRQIVAIGFEISLSQDIIVCFDVLESVPYNIFQSAILANVGVKDT
jgi:hypothetical protein